ncbi:hypothetical protein ACQR50_09290 [Sphingomonas sp. Xoc002]|uniref:hypothetical protein n=1 Tax=unclassified Sphingomonas TaxID=196159 RepID=UPI000B18A1A6|nr:hypothetical protein [Sphingomonas sp. Leaf257]
MTLYLVSGADGEPRRKISCPPAEIEAQLGEGETFAEVDPLVDGFGLTTPSGDA